MIATLTIEKGLDTKMQFRIKHRKLKWRRLPRERERVNVRCVSVYPSGISTVVS